MLTTEKDYFGLDEACKILGVHRTTLMVWIRRNEEIRKKNPDELTESDKKVKCPPYGRVGIRYRFKKEDLEKFIQDGRNEGM